MLEAALVAAMADELMGFSIKTQKYPKDVQR